MDNDEAKLKVTGQSDDIQKKKAAYALNLCTVSVSQIIDYNDLYILEQEYDAILNNLNLQNIEKDNSLLKVLKQILDTITFFRIQEGERKLIEAEYQHKIKNAIWSAVPSFSVFFSGGSLLSTVIGAVTQVGVGYMNYRKNKNEYALERSKQEWELQRSAMEQFHGLRRELFETAWRMAEKHGYNDAFRLTEKQIARYNAILIDPDPLRRREKLDYISKDFEAFPPFWYFKGNAAREVSANKKYPEEIRKTHRQQALNAFEKFDKDYEYLRLAREDVLAASCALEHISLLDPECDKVKITDLLEKAIDYAGDNFDILQMVVVVYFSIDQKDDAINTLRKLVNEEYNLGVNGYLLSKYYLNQNSEFEYKIIKDRIGEKYVVPWVEEDVFGRSELLADQLKEKYINRMDDGFRGVKKPIMFRFSSDNEPYSLFVKIIQQMLNEATDLLLLLGDESNANYDVWHEIKRCYDELNIKNNEFKKAKKEVGDSELKSISSIFCDIISTNLKNGYRKFSDNKSQTKELIEKLDVWYLRNGYVIPVKRFDPAPKQLTFTAPQSQK